MEPRPQANLVKAPVRKTGELGSKPRGPTKQGARARWQCTGLQNLGDPDRYRGAHPISAGVVYWLRPGGATAQKQVRFLPSAPSMRAWSSWRGPLASNQVRWVRLPQPAPKFTSEVYRLHAGLQLRADRVQFLALVPRFHRLSVGHQTFTLRRRVRLSLEAPLSDNEGISKSICSRVGYMVRSPSFEVGEPGSIPGPGAIIIWRIIRAPFCTLAPAGRRAYRRPMFILRYRLRLI